MSSLIASNSVPIPVQLPDTTSIAMALAWQLAKNILSQLLLQENSSATTPVPLTNISTATALV